jgi:hypothetical protein
MVTISNPVPFEAYKLPFAAGCSPALVEIMIALEIQIVIAGLRPIACVDDFRNQ